MPYKDKAVRKEKAKLYVRARRARKQLAEAQAAQRRDAGDAAN
jgi:predicted DNA binding CopG/RHH family protein